MSIDVATREGIATILDERFRASFLLARHAIVLPTTHSHDEILPFWRDGDARPSDADALKRARGRAPAAPDAPFVPADIHGGPGTLGGPAILGCGYMEFVIEDGGNPSTSQPGVLGCQTDEPIALQLWFYTPSARSTEIDDRYTGAARAIFDNTRIGRSYFESYFPPGEGVLWIEQIQPIPAADRRRPAGTYKRSGIRIPLLRRTSVVKN